jgi:hypothetical protein
VRAFASFLDLALLFLEKNGIAAKQLLSRANVAIPLSMIRGQPYLGRSLRKELWWSLINSAYVDKKKGVLATPNLDLWKLYRKNV